VFAVLPTLAAGSVDCADWLREKYVADGLSTYQIARLVGRDPKTVWAWLKKHGIPLRKRNWSNRPSQTTRPYQSPGWLWAEYFFGGRTIPDIAAQFDVWPQTVMYFIRKAGIPTRPISDTRAIKHWGTSGEGNPMFGVRGELHHNWKGGHTPERQAFYASTEWREVFKAVWKRDRKRCRRCDFTHRKGARLEVHHVVPFEAAELRATLGNLVLLCVKCHHWVHSKANTDRLFLPQEA
jgi:hypothetical protein